jgi:hypothetical protein
MSLFKIGASAWKCALDVFVLSSVFFSGLVWSRLFSRGTCCLGQLDSNYLNNNAASQLLNMVVNFVA